ncbi:mycofactocin biosynthesis peptidyl-dipeptidase MftE [Streptomyces sp. NBC_01352]|uniref:Mycofactocin biosynthesis peptidyl-dipeptidase MftE n=1 Tax=Streptomyces plumbiresistens TaxID=511811 RepID=A0ABP7SB55_9ACTN|nr:mycofactocin biosynthesis peptidyl-dipeptidase MftE [Streptomyces sp. NBC_01352]
MTAELSHLAWTAIPDRPLVLVPLGSFEQHGPHLPLDTDTRIADAVANAVARRLGEKTLVAPPVVYAASGEHQGFPGTMSIGNEALRFMLVELVRSLALWAGRVVFVNGHGGNVRCLSGVAAQLAQEGRDVAWIPCFPAGGDAHAGHTETSLMLHLAPRLVHLSRAERGNTAPLAELMPAMLAGGVGAVAPSGVLGDPTTATADEGARLFDELVAGVERALR